LNIGILRHTFWFCDLGDDQFG